MLITCNLARSDTKISYINHGHFMLVRRVLLKKEWSTWRRNMSSESIHLSVTQCLVNVRQKNADEGGVNAFVAFNQARVSEL